MGGTGALDPASWDSRRTSFGSVAAEYAALRPGYPADAVRFVLGDRPRRVLDLGAGTGLLTDVLVASGHDVIAVDPSPEMLAQLSGRSTGITALTGSAEQIPLPDGDVDAVVAGQAAHWFDPDAASREMRRVLRPCGVVGLIWNERDDRVPWVAALTDVISDVARDHAADQDVVGAFVAGLPADLEQRTFAFEQEVSPEQVVRGIGTRSYAAVMDAGSRAAFLDRIRTLLGTHPDTRDRATLRLPYRTEAYRLTPRS